MSWQPLFVGAEAEPYRRFIEKVVDGFTALKRETLVVLDPDKLNQVVGGHFRCCVHGPVTSA